MQLACFSNFFSLCLLPRERSFTANPKGDVALVTLFPSAADEEMEGEDGAGTDRYAGDAGDADSDGAGDNEQLELPPLKLLLSNLALRQSTAIAGLLLLLLLLLLASAESLRSQEMLPLLEPHGEMWWCCMDMRLRSLASRFGIVDIIFIFHHHRVFFFQHIFP